MKISNKKDDRLIIRISSEKKSRLENVALQKNMTVAKFVNAIIDVYLIHNVEKKYTRFQKSKEIMDNDYAKTRFDNLL